MRPIFLILAVTLPSFALASPSSFLDGLTAHVTLAMGSSVIIAGVLEFVFRMIPTPKPLSWAWLLSAGLHSLSKLSEAVAEFMDKVLPQNLSK